MTAHSLKLKRTAAVLAMALALTSVAALTPGQAQTQTPTQPKTPAPRTPSSDKAGSKAKDKTQAKAKASAGVKTPVDLNTASAEEMIEVLPGVGEVTAGKIVAGRPYKAVDDLAKAGVPASTIRAIRPLVTVSAPAPAGSTATATANAKAKSKAVAKGTPASSGGKIDLNTATAAELESLPGIGPAHARAIIAARPFKTPEDLYRIRGLGRAGVEKILDRVAVAPPAPPAETAPAPAARTATKPAMTRPGAAKTPTAGTPRLAPGRRVNLNTATKAELDALPGIGPVKAQAIIDARPFRTPADVMKVKGIKEGEYGKIKDLITVE
jgi:competence protein ComEA